MAAAFGRLQLQVEKTGISVTIPSNPKAKLMYYLDCICNVLELGSDASNLRRLRDYENYYRLTEDETNELLLLCALISPKVLLNKCIFQDDDMCGDSNNEFYKIQAVRHRMVVASSIMIGGQTKSVNKIMCFKMSWLRQYYLQPMEHFQQKLEREQAARRRQEDNCIIL